MNHRIRRPSDRGVNPASLVLSDEPNNARIVRSMKHLPSLGSEIPFLCAIHRPYPELQLNRKAADTIQRIEKVRSEQSGRRDLAR
jgi:hypothetical protein